MDAPDLDSLRRAAWAGEDRLAPGRLFDALVAAPEHVTRDDVDRLRLALVDPDPLTRAITLSQGGQSYKLAALYRARPDLFTAHEGATIDPHWTIEAGMGLLVGIGLIGGAALGIQRWGLQTAWPVVGSTVAGVAVSVLPWFVLEPILHRRAHTLALRRAKR